MIFKKNWLQKIDLRRKYEYFSYYLAIPASPYSETAQASMEITKLISNPLITYKAIGFNATSTCPPVSSAHRSSDCSQCDRLHHHQHPANSGRCRSQTKSGGAARRIRYLQQGLLQRESFDLSGPRSAEQQKRAVPGPTRTTHV